MKSVLDRFFSYALTVPAGTAIDAPQETDIPIDNLILADVGIQIPDGPCGLAGIAFEFSNQLILPWDEGTGWIQGNNLVADFQVGLEVGPGNLQVLQYNLGVYDHTFYVRLHMQYLPHVAAPVAPPVALVLDSEVA